MYEYPLNGQWIMLDMDDGYVLWTGIWKGAPPAPLAGRGRGRPRPCAVMLCLLVS